MARDYISRKWSASARKWVERLNPEAPTYISAEKYLEQFQPEWHVGPADVSEREVADAYNFLSKKGKLPRGMSLARASETLQMEGELYRRGLIAKEFMPAGRVEPFRAQLEYLPTAGAEIEAAGAQIPYGLAKYKDRPEIIRNILRGKTTEFEARVLPDIAATWEEKLGRLPATQRRELVARFRGQFNVPGTETIVSNVDDIGRLLDGRAEVAALQQAGKLSYVNPVDVRGITARDIRPDILSNEIARQHIRSGAFLSEPGLLRKGLTVQEINALRPYGGFTNDWTATGRYLPGTKGEYKFLTRLMPDITGEVPVDYRNLQLGAGPAAQDAIETQAIRSAATKRRQVIIRERDGATAAFYSSKPRAAALRRARGRVAMGAAPVAPGVGRAATQVSTALTAANQAIKESALLPDIRRPEFLIPGGKLRLDLRPFDLAEDLLEKYPGTTKGIEVRLGGKRLGMVPYSGRAGGRGSLINKILESRQSAAYLQAQGTFKGTKPWARMTLLPETAGGKIIPIRNVPVAGITFGEFGKAEQMAQKAATRTTQLEGSAFLKSWMDKIPTRWKIGAAAVGITIGALMLSRRGKMGQDLAIEPGEYPDASLYGGLRSGIIPPEGMEEEDFRERIGNRAQQPIAPMSYNARIEDPNSIQTNIRIKTGTKRRTNFEAVGRAIGLTASDRSGAELGNVNVRVMDDSKRMNDQYIDRKIARFI